ncbi:DUF397 domain-containing protein [Spongiactinospora gelatinilytica]|uniref:DUF397 domain-containing protein n=1 Tax=Spongiactinospora gelatinilytica TaxID=2666298 RepID=A0A2W2G5A3_9ACTN|nr:DUF397 domain-containing protein [Spongiactinospora gelatinilytica]PZG43082.1 DUF397 domain-containing protein [Spongiactinospora gelatinilytica]
MAVWRRSSRSGDSGGNCVEVASNTNGLVAVRDSKAPAEAVLFFPPREWRVFLGRVKAGEFG